MLPVVVCSGCLVGPTSYRLDFPKSDIVRCSPVRIESGWTFDANSTDAIPYTDNRHGFAVRWETPDSSSFLLAGSEIRNGQTAFSHERYRVSLSANITIEPVSDSYWQRAIPAELIRRPATPAEEPTHRWIPPRISFGERSYPLSGKIFWNAPEVTRRSQRDVWILGISYTDWQGVTRPKAWAHFDVFSTATGRRVLSAKGESPQLPPFSQFEAVAWLGDSILLMPHNGVGTNFDACYFQPEDVKK